MSSRYRPPIELDKASYPPLWWHPDTWVPARVEFERFDDEYEAQLELPVFDSADATTKWQGSRTAVIKGVGADVMAAYLDLQRRLAGIGLYASRPLADLLRLSAEELARAPAHEIQRVLLAQRGALEHLLQGGERRVHRQLSCGCCCGCCRETVVVDVVDGTEIEYARGETVVDVVSAIYRNGDHWL